MRPSTSAATRWPSPNRAAASCVVNGRAGAGVSAEQFAERIGDAIGEDRGHADRHRDADAVAQQADVLDGDPPRLAGERHRERPFGLAQTLQPAADVVGGAPLGDLGLGQRPQQPQQVGDALGVAGRAVLGEVLQLAAVLAITCGSSSSRSSTRPNSSASSVLSSDSAAARRSASGLSPSYMNAPT